MGKLVMGRKKSNTIGLNLEDGRINNTVVLKEETNHRIGRVLDSTQRVQCVDNGSRGTKWVIKDYVLGCLFL